VTRVLPDTLEIHVTEHEAVGVLLAGTFYLIDAEGQPFKLLEDGERGELPVISGLSGLDPLEHPVRSQERIRRAVDVLTAYETKRRPRLSEVNVDDSGVATLYTAELGTQLRLGRGDIDAALSRYDALRAALGADSDKLAVAHLDATATPEAPERVVASFFAAEDLPGFVADAQERTREKAALAQEAEDEKKSKRARAAAGFGGKKKRSRLPKYE
jgi:cell division protein FtsQ